MVVILVLENTEFIGVFGNNQTINIIILKPYNV